MRIDFAATDTSITVWWEQPEAVPEDAVYTVTLNEKAVQRVNRTRTARLKI